jgi:hypothetical protein
MSACFTNFCISLFYFYFFCKLFLNVSPQTTNLLSKVDGRVDGQFAGGLLARAALEQEDESIDGPKENMLDNRNRKWAINIYFNCANVASSSNE